MLSMSSDWRVIGSNADLMTFDFEIPVVLSLSRAGSMLPDSPARETLLDRLAVDKTRFSWVRQEHTTRVVDARPGMAGVADGLHTGDRSMVLGISVADCMPIVVADRAHGCVALLHSGRRGTGILREAVQVLQRVYGSRVEDLAVLLGPAISVAQYAVDAESAATFAAEFGAATVQQIAGRHHVDMRTANRRMCAELRIGTVIDVELCTYTSPEMGSYRREGPGYTRMLMLAGEIHVDDVTQAVGEETRSSKERW
jgi:polyphenol oxidase